MKQLIIRCLTASAIALAITNQTAHALQNLRDIAQKTGVSVTDMLRVDGVEHHAASHYYSASYSASAKPVDSVVQLRMEHDHTFVEPRAAVVEKALASLGVSYRYGASNLITGVDCSGLVKAVFKEGAGIELPHNAAMQAKLAQPVAQNQHAPGDLVFFNTRGSRHSHVGIVTKGNEFIHASTLMKKVVVQHMHNPYWRKRFTEARTFLSTTPH